MGTAQTRTHTCTLYANCGVMRRLSAHNIPLAGVVCVIIIIVGVGCPIVVVVARVKFQRRSGTDKDLQVKEKRFKSSAQCSREHTIMAHSRRLQLSMTCFRLRFVRRKTYYVILQTMDRRLIIEYQLPHANE